MVEISLVPYDPPKVGMFWWRVAHDILPTERNLLVHHVPVPDICPLCNTRGDSTIHALFKCPSIKGYWKECEFKYLIKPIQHQETFQVICWLIDNLQMREFEELAMRGWAIWSLRLRIIHKHKEEMVQHGVLWSSNYLKDHKCTP